MPSRRDNTLLSVGLLCVLLVVVVVLLTLLGSTVLPQAGAGLIFVLALAAFLLVQVWIFRLLGLRSRADQNDDEEPPADEDPDWRAWRG